MIFFEKYKSKLVSFVDLWPKMSWVLRSKYNYFFGEKELSFVSRLSQLMNGCVSIDVGANTGVYTFYLSRYSKLVFAFEPLNILNDYWGELNKKNILHINSAVGDSCDDVEIQAPKISGKVIHGIAKIEKTKSFDVNSYVQLTNQTKLDLLDNFFDLIKVDKLIIKIDVEGYEGNVLNGAKVIIEKYQPVLLIEIEKRHNKNYEDVFKLLFSLSYSSYIYINSKLIKVDSSECEKQFNNVDTKSYVNNFIFINHTNDVHAKILDFMT